MKKVHSVAVADDDGEEPQQEEDVVPEDAEDLIEEAEQALSTELADTAGEPLVRADMRCRGGFDMGSVNYAFSIVEYMTAEQVAAEIYRDKPLPTGCFPMIGRMVDWKNVSLGPHEQDPCIDAMPTKLCRTSLAIRSNWLVQVLIEQQNPNTNPVCAGLYCATRSMFRTMGMLTGTDRPHQITAINPQKKFGYFGFKCPEGEKHRYERKQLSVDIVTMLFKMWVSQGYMSRSWLNIIIRAKKRDDFADSFLLMYAEVAQEMYGDAPFEACATVIRYVQTKKYFAKGTITLCAKFQTAVLRLENKLAKEAEAKNGQKRKRNETPKKPPMKERRHTVDMNYVAEISRRKGAANQATLSAAGTMVAPIKLLDLTTNDDEDADQTVVPCRKVAESAKRRSDMTSNGDDDGLIDVRSFLLLDRTAPPL